MDDKNFEERKMDIWTNIVHRWKTDRQIDRQIDREIERQTNR